MIRYIYISKYDSIFVTMPPFRNWSLCFLPGVKIILDIRDGWSIGMRNGYGGTAKPNILKAWIARIVEQLAIKSSALTITCTPGLKRYHATRWTRGKLTLIPNGFPDEDVEYAQAIVNGKIGKPQSFKDHIRFVCAGKFGEYGSKNVEILFDAIKKRYGGSVCEIDIFANSKEKQSIVYEISRKYNNIICNVYDFLSRDILLEKISNYDIGIVLLRDQEYEFGTKIFDYIICGIPIFDYFAPGDIKRFFAGYFDTDYKCPCEVIRFSRSAMIRSSLELKRVVETVE